MSTPRRAPAGPSASPDSGLLDRLAAPALLVLLAACALLVLARPLIGLPLVDDWNINEGWNAYHALRAFGSEPLYYGVDDLVTNNYPPLSFYLMGGLAWLGADPIIAGRWVALASLLAVAWMAALIVRRLGGSPFAATVAALLLLAYAGARFTPYVAGNDPQWLAHALMTGGLLALLGGALTPARVVLAAALMLIAGLVKHNLLPLPVAVTLWLLVHDRRALAVWLAAALLLLAAAGAAFYLFHGPDLLTSLLATPRRYQPFSVLRRGYFWMLPMAPMLAVAAVLALLERRDRDLQLLVLYAGLSLAWGAVVLGGAGIGVNAVFDAAIALVILGAVACDRLPRALAGARITPGAVRALVVLALMLAVLRVVPERSRDLADYLSTFEERRAAVAEDIAFLAERDGPALCDRLSLCFWAGKEMAFDFFNFGEKLLTGTIDPEPVLRALDERRFAVIQLRRPELVPGADERPAALSAAIARNYELARHSPVHGGLLVPRGEGG